LPVTQLHLYPSTKVTKTDGRYSRVFSLVNPNYKYTPEIWSKVARDDTDVLTPDNRTPELG
jgi:hypothetical protein